MSFVKKLAGETMIYGLSSILPRIIFFLFITSYLTYRFPDTTYYGIYSELYAYSTVILVLFIFRMDTAYFRFGAKTEDQDGIFGAAFIPVFFMTLMGVATMYVFSENIATILKYDGDGYYIRWFSFILGFDAIAAMFYGRFRLQSRPKRFLFYRLVNVGITLFCVFLFLEILPAMGIEGPPVKRLIDYVFISNLIASIGVLVIMLPDIIKIKWSIARGQWKKMFWYSFPLVLVGIAGNINQTFAVPLQKFFLGENYSENLAIAGEYAGPARIALLLNLFTVAFNYAAEPFFFNNVGKKNAEKAYGQIAHVFTLVAGIAMMGIVSFQEIAILIIGESYRGPQDIIPILLFANLFLGLYYNVSIWYKLSDKTAYGAYISIGGAVITLIISIGLLPSYGYIVSAYAALACYAFMLGAGYLLGQKHYPIDYPVKKVVSLIFFFLLAIVGTITLKSCVTSDVVKLLIGFVCFALFLLILYRLDWKNLLKYLG